MSLERNSSIKQLCVARLYLFVYFRIRENDLGTSALWEDLHFLTWVCGGCWQSCLTYHFSHFQFLGISSYLSALLLQD